MVPIPNIMRETSIMQEINFETIGRKIKSTAFQSDLPRKMLQMQQMSTQLYQQYRKLQGHDLP